MKLRTARLPVRLPPGGLDWELPAAPPPPDAYAQATARSSGRLSYLESPAPSESLTYKPLPPPPPVFTGRHHPEDGPALAKAAAISEPPTAASLRHGSRFHHQESDTAGTRSTGFARGVVSDASMHAATAVFIPAACGQHLSRQFLTALGGGHGGLLVCVAASVEVSKCRADKPCVLGGRFGRGLPGHVVRLGAHSAAGWAGFIRALDKACGHPRCRVRGVVDVTTGQQSDVDSIGKVVGLQELTSNVAAFVYVRRTCPHKHAPVPAPDPFGIHYRDVELEPALDPALEPATTEVLTPPPEALRAPGRSWTTVSGAAQVVVVNTATGRQRPVRRNTPSRSFEAERGPGSPRLPTGRSLSTRPQTARDVDASVIQTVREECISLAALDDRLARSILSVVTARGQLPSRASISAAAATFDAAVSAMGMADKNMLADVLRREWGTVAALSGDVGSDSE